MRIIQKTLLFSGINYVKGLRNTRSIMRRKAGRTFPKYNLRDYWGGSTQILDFEDKLLGLKI
jgi:hypothetical protein